MKGTNRIIARLARSRLLLLGALLLIAALVAAPTATAAGRVPKIEGGLYFQLPWDTSSHSVTVAPDGVPWFGTNALSTLTLASAPAGMLQVTELDPDRELVGSNEEGMTSSLRFDAQGNLWFARSDKLGKALVRRAPDGTETAFDLPGTEAVDSLTIGAEGNVWFARGPQIVEMTPAGAVTRFPLAAKSHPASIVTGPDGTLWFTEQSAGKIGRMTPDGQLRFFALGRGVGPRRLVVGPDGALWFSENGRRGPGKKSFDRIGRITTGGKVSQFPIRFGGSTYQLAADPRGLIWFTTAKNEISSISTTGTVGRRGCLGKCSPAFNDIAVTPEGAIWFALEKEYLSCRECGGGAGLILQHEGAIVGEIPPGALAPAPVASP
jgi:streptogramin lyase